MKHFRYWIILFCVLGVARAIPENYGTAPVDVQAAMFLKLLGFNNKLKGDVTVFVVESPEFAAALKKGVGKPIGSAGTLTEVTSGAELPKGKPGVIYVASEDRAKAVMGWARINKSLSITGNPVLVEKGISLGIGVLEDKPRVLLNIMAAKEEELDLNPAMLKIATVFR